MKALVKKEGFVIAFTEAGINLWCDGNEFTLDDEMQKSLKAVLCVSELTENQKTTRLLRNAAHDYKICRGEQERVLELLLKFDDSRYMFQVIQDFKRELRRCDDNDESKG